MADLNKLSIKEALSGLLSKEFSAVELVQDHLDSMEKHRGLNTYVFPTPELALKLADESDRRIAKNLALPLDGIPVGVKDLYCTNGIRTTSCSNILKDFIPKYESTVTTNLFAAGAIMLGKTNMDEFAMGSSNLTSCFGHVVNPWKRSNSEDEVVPGGSSGGSAACVAANLGMASLGSDTGGSVRQPASFCGIVGIKPSYGRCSRFGMIAFASSLDQAAVFAKNVEDSALVLSSIMGHDPKDSTSSKAIIPDFSSCFKDGDLRGLRVGIPKEYLENLHDDISKMMKNSICNLKELGAEIIDISLPHTKYALPTYYIIAPAEASSNLARYDGVRYGLRVSEDGDSLDDLYEKTREIGFGQEVKRRILIGTFVLSSEHYEDTYLKAQRVRRLIANDFNNVFDKIDVILTPTTSSEAFGIKDVLTPVQMYMNDVFTIPASLAGLPCLSIPGALSRSGLPLGIQLIANNFDELTLLRVAHKLEKSINFTAKPKGY